MHMQTIRIITYLGLFLLLLPFQILPDMFPMMDKVGHFMIMSLITIHLANFLSDRKSVLIAFMIGVVIEYSQHFMEGRTGSVDDVLANTAGILFAWFLLSFFEKKED